MHVWECVESVPPYTMYWLGGFSVMLFIRAIESKLEHIMWDPGTERRSAGLGTGPLYPLSHMATHPGTVCEVLGVVNKPNLVMEIS